jgi:hypothetical protein
MAVSEPHAAGCSAVGLLRFPQVVRHACRQPILSCAQLEYFHVAVRSTQARSSAAAMSLLCCCSPAGAAGEAPGPVVINVKEAGGGGAAAIGSDGVLSSSVVVAVRLRPMVTRETALKSSTAVEPTGPTSVSCALPQLQAGGSPHPWVAQRLCATLP